MTHPSRGIYETILTEALDKELATLAAGLRESREKLRPAEAADRLSLHISRIVRRLIATVDEKDRVAIGVKLTRSLINTIDKIAQTRLPELSDAIDPTERPAVPEHSFARSCRYSPMGRQKKSVRQKFRCSTRRSSQTPRVSRPWAAKCSPKSTPRIPSIL